MRSRDRLGRLTDARVLPLTTQVLDRDGYRVILTAAFPTFWFGNVLSLDAPPEMDQLSYWFEVCRREFADDPDVQKLILDWETGPDESFPVEALPLGTSYECGTVLRVDAASLSTGPLADFVWRPISGDAGWEAVIGLACEEFGDDAFERWRLQAYRESIVKLGGCWWGAWQGDLLVGACGLFHAPDFLRFQEVVTRRAYRRRGICSALCKVALRDAWRRHPKAAGVIVAERGSDAERLYRRLGFRPVGAQHALLQSR